MATTKLKSYQTTKAPVPIDEAAPDKRIKALLRSLIDTSLDNRATALQLNDAVFGDSDQDLDAALDPKSGLMTHLEHILALNAETNKYLMSLHEVLYDCSE